MESQFWIGLLQIIWIDLLLSGDNAVVIALACRGLPEKQRKWGILLGAGAAVGLRILFALVITYLLAVPFLKLIGGLLLFWIAFEMVFERRGERKAQTAETAITQDHIRNVAAFPLAIPLMAGPGALTAVMLLAGRAEGEATLLAALAAITALVIGTCLLIFFGASSIARLLGVTGNVVLTRLLGVILAALAVQFVIDGIHAAIRAG